MLHSFRNGFCGVTNGLNGLIRGLFQFIFARADHHANYCTGQHAEANAAQKSIVLHCITPCIV